jgi:hypothetical protein
LKRGTYKGDLALAFNDMDYAQDMKYWHRILRLEGNKAYEQHVQKLCRKDRKRVRGLATSYIVVPHIDFSPPSNTKRKQNPAESSSIADQPSLPPNSTNPTWPQSVSPSSTLPSLPNDPVDASRNAQSSSSPTPAARLKPRQRCQLKLFVPELHAGMQPQVPVLNKYIPEYHWGGTRNKPLKFTLGGLLRRDLSWCNSAEEAHQPQMHHYTVPATSMTLEELEPFCTLDHPLVNRAWHIERAKFWKVMAVLAHQNQYMDSILPVHLLEVDAELEVATVLVGDPQKNDRLVLPLDSLERYWRLGNCVHIVFGVHKGVVGTIVESKLNSGRELTLLVPDNWPIVAHVERPEKLVSILSDVPLCSSPIPSGVYKIQLGCR